MLNLDNKLNNKFANLIVIVINVEKMDFCWMEDVSHVQLEVNGMGKVVFMKEMIQSHKQKQKFLKYKQLNKIQQVVLLFQNQWQYLKIKKLGQRIKKSLYLINKICKEILYLFHNNKESNLN